MRRFRSQGIARFTLLPVDECVPSLSEVRSVLKNSDVIYLAGGNTFYFLYHLKKSGVLPLLKQAAAEGRVMVGLSAGALILSPTIRSAGDPGLDPDENEVNLKNFTGLKLFDFEFSPHLRRSKAHRDAHALYSARSKHLVLAMADGSGVVIDGDQEWVYGEGAAFYQGRGLRLK
jgi:dipeptidase E